MIYSRSERRKIANRIIAIILCSCLAGLIIGYIIALNRDLISFAVNIIVMNMIAIIADDIWAIPLYFIGIVFIILIGYLAVKLYGIRKNRKQLWDILMKELFPNVKN